MPAPVQRLAPNWSRVVVAFVGAFAAAAVPILIPLALGITVPDDKVGALVAVVLIYSVAFMVGIFLSGQWAARIEPEATTTPLPLEEVRRRILALNSLAIPFQVREVAPNHFFVEWKGDAVRTQSTSTGGVRAFSRVKLRLVEASHQARAVDLQAQLEWSDDREHFQWHGSFRFFRGITFASYQQGPQYGLALRRGEWAVSEGHRYDFVIDELKQPLVQAVVLSGWTWQPVVFR